MYRLILESLLGLTRTANHLKLEPRMPENWTTFTLTYRYASATYEIRVNKGATSASVMSVDGVPQPDGLIALQDSGRTHRVELLVPAGSPPVAALLNAEGGAGA